jgi:glutaredoxin 3
MPASDTVKTAAKAATEKVLHALNRADEIGGEVRDYIQDKVLVDPRYVAMRKRLAALTGKAYTSRAEATSKAVRAEASRAAAAAPTPAPAKKPAERPLGDAELKAQIYGKKSCPWTGRAITLLEKHKVDYDYVNLEEPEYELLHPRLATETKQSTVPYVYLRGQFIGGFNALSEIERLGQLEVAMMTAEERKSAPAHLRMVEVVARPNTDEVVPVEQDASAKE